METPKGVFITPQQVATKALDSIGTILKEQGVSLDELIASGRDIRTALLQETYGITQPPRRIFLDSSVLYAAAFSPTGPARRLILKGLQGSVTLCISDRVLAETKRNLAKNAPAALPAFAIIVGLLSPYIPAKRSTRLRAQVERNLTTT